MDILLPRIDYLKLIEEPWRKSEYDAEQERYNRDLWEALNPTPLGLNSLGHNPTRWLVNQLLPQGYLAILAGEPKAGKTCIATAIALAVATGTPFAGFEVRQGSVLWMCREESHEERKNLLRHTPDHLRLPEGEFSRLQELNGSELACIDWADYIPLFNVFHRIPIDTDGGIQVLKDMCSLIDCRLLVIDPLHGAHSGRSLQDGWAARKTLTKIKEMAADLDVTVLILHHCARRGPARVAENAQLSATASMFWIMNSHPLAPMNGGERGLGGEGFSPSPRMPRVAGRGQGGGETPVPLSLRRQGEGLGEGVSPRTPPLPAGRSCREEEGAGGRGSG